MSSSLIPILVSQAAKLWWSDKPVLRLTLPLRQAFRLKASALKAQGQGFGSGQVLIPAEGRGAGRFVVRQAHHERVEFTTDELSLTTNGFSSPRTR